MNKQADLKCCFNYIYILNTSRVWYTENTATINRNCHYYSLMMMWCTCKLTLKLNRHGIYFFDPGEKVLTCCQI